MLMRFLIALFAASGIALAADSVRLPVVVDTNGMLLAPTNFFGINQAKLNAAVTNVASGGPGVTNDFTITPNLSTNSFTRSVNGKSNVVSLTTSDIPEGTNQYWNTTRTNGVAFASDVAANYDVKNAAHDATNSLGSAAFKLVGFFDAAGSATTAAHDATNTYPWSPLYDAANRAHDATNGYPWGVQYDAVGSATTAAHDSTNNYPWLTLCVTNNATNATIVTLNVTKLVYDPVVGQTNWVDGMFSVWSNMDGSAFSWVKSDGTVYSTNINGTRLSGGGNQTNSGVISATFYGTLHGKSDTSGVADSAGSVPGSGITAGTITQVTDATNKLATDLETYANNAAKSVTNNTGGILQIVTNAGPLAVKVGNAALSDNASAYGGAIAGSQVTGASTVTNGLASQAYADNSAKNVTNNTGAVVAIVTNFGTLPVKVGNAVLADSSSAYGGAVAGSQVTGTTTVTNGMASQQYVQQATNAAGIIQIVTNAASPVPMKVGNAVLADSATAYSGSLTINQVTNPFSAQPTLNANVNGNAATATSASTINGFMAVTQGMNVIGGMMFSNPVIIYSGTAGISSLGSGTNAFEVSTAYKLKTFEFATNGYFKTIGAATANGFNYGTTSGSPDYGHWGGVFGSQPWGVYGESIAGSMLYGGTSYPIVGLSVYSTGIGIGLYVDTTGTNACVTHHLRVGTNIYAGGTITATNGYVLPQLPWIPTNSIPGTNGSANNTVTNWILVNLSNNFFIGGSTYATYPGGPTWIATNSAVAGGFILKQPSWTTTLIP